MELGVRNVQKYEWNAHRIEDKGDQTAHRKLRYGLNNDRMIDLIAMAKLDYTFGLFFNYGD